MAPFRWLFKRVPGRSESKRGVHHLDCTSAWHPLEKSQVLDESAVQAAIFFAPPPPLPTMNPTNLQQFHGGLLEGCKIGMGMNPQAFLVHARVHAHP